jgi:serine/threonine-protein kinase HipA
LYRDRIRPTRTRVHPYFANLLPEGPLRVYLAAHARIKPGRDFPLLRLLGADLPGALILRDHDANAAPPVESALLRFSLAGVQLKFSAGGTPKRGLTISAGGLGGNWIVKLPDQRFDRVSENEFSMMTFATKVGIDVPAIGLVDPNDVAGLPEDIRNLTGKAFYIERFDRTPQGGRIHTEDFAQANMLYPAQKYSFFNFDMLGEQVAVHLGGDAALDLIGRIVFNVGIGNGDMHAKNWSVIYRAGRTPSLAPAYDYVSTVVYMPRDDIGMNLAGTKSFGDIDDDRLVRLANHARLPRKPVLDAAHDMVDRMRETWPTIESDLPMSVEHRAIVERHMDSVPLFAPRTPTARR